MSEHRPDNGREGPRVRPVDLLLAAAPLLAFGLLAAFVLADPASGITSSNGPRTDEAWDMINARNLVLLGRWSTDDWNLHLVNVPYSAIVAAVFSLAGVGMAQARLVSIAATALTVAALGVGLRRSLGSKPALLAAVAFAGSTLVLFYGRLAFLEPSVAWWLTVGGLLTLRARSDRSGRWGLLAGVALALAVGTKPSAAFATAGILAGLAITGFRSPQVRRWLAGAVAAIVVAGIGWVLLVGLPNRDAIATDLRIWPSEPMFRSLGALVHDIATFPMRNDGFLRLGVPILAFGAAGGVLVFRGRLTLSPELAGLAAAVVGWLVLGLGLLVLAPYRPNRYEVPMLPALAILGALGWRCLGVAAATWPRFRFAASTGLVVAWLVLPGLVLYGSWMRAATYRLPEIQATVAAAMHPGDVAQGDLAPAFALRAPVVTIVSKPATRVNPGDLYATRGVRWYVGAAGSAPAWATRHAQAWAARTVLLCAPWSGGAPVCVWHLP